jgi:hypothetical protein
MNSKGTLEGQVEAAEGRWLDGWKQGPTRLRWEVMPVQVGDQAPDEFVVDRTGKITLAYRYQYCEDFPNPLVHIAAIKEAKSV